MYTHLNRNIYSNKIRKGRSLAITIIFLVSLIATVLGVTYWGNKTVEKLDQTNERLDKEFEEIKNSVDSLKEARLVKKAQAETVKGEYKNATITGYTSHEWQTDATPEVGANGENIWHLYQKGEQTCASNDYPMGQKLTISNLGTCTVRDRMNDRYTGTGRIDWYFGKDLNQAISYGQKEVVILVSSE